MIPVNKYSIGQLQEITCYIYYNGPGLSSLKNDKNERFLGVWVEFAHEKDTFIYLPITQPQERQLDRVFDSSNNTPNNTLARSTLIRSIMLNSPTFYKIQFFQNGEEIFEECFESVPEKWLVAPVE
jgi:hypothetical protein